MRPTPPNTVAGLRGRLARRRGLAVGAVGIVLAGSLYGLGPATAIASSHREAPLIAADPAVDNTDLYAFTSPERPDTVTFITNWTPFEEPNGGPNFFPFATDATYNVNIDNDGDARADITFRWTFRNIDKRRNKTFLYNDGPVTSLNDENLLFRQTYKLEVATEGGGFRTIAKDQPVAPSRTGRASMPDYKKLRDQAVVNMGNGLKGFAGQADDPFFLDLRVFDLLYGGNLSETGQDSLAGYNVNTLALQVPMRDLALRGDARRNPVIGTWATAERDRVRITGDDRDNDRDGRDDRDKDRDGYRDYGRNNDDRNNNRDNGRGVIYYDNGVVRYDGRNNGNRGNNDRSKDNRGNDNRGNGRDDDLVQVSRLGNPLVNEVVAPAGLKDAFNSLRPDQDANVKELVDRVLDPEVPKLVEAIYKIPAPKGPRNDLVEIFLTGITTKAGGPIKVDLNSQLNNTDVDPRRFVPSEQLRLNMAVPVARNVNRLGVLAGDTQGFPNGRRLGDDVIDIGLQALEGAAQNGKLVDALAAGDKVNNNDRGLGNHFPYVAEPNVDGVNTRGGQVNGKKVGLFDGDTPGGPYALIALAAMVALAGVAFSWWRRQNTAAALAPVTQTGQASQDGQLAAGQPSLVNRIGQLARGGAEQTHIGRRRAGGQDTAPNRPDPNQST